MIAAPLPRESLLYAVKQLPAAPRILAAMGRLLLDVNTGLADFTELIKRDSALTTRILRISNSALYNVGSPFNSLEEALARVGFMEVYRITGFAAVAGVSDRNLPLYGVSGVQFRENSLCVALVAEALAQAAGDDSRAAYTAGLLRSLGKLALDGLTRNGPYNATYLPQRGPLLDWEFAVTGLTNCDAATLILREWHFRSDTIAVIAGHYQPGARSPRLAQLLNLAAGVAEGSGHGLPGEATYWRLSREAQEACGLDPAQVDEAIARALVNFASVRAAVA